MPVRIRTAEKGDVPAIQAVYAHHVRFGTGTFELEPPHCAEMELRHAAIVEGGYPYLVAEVDGVIAGYGYAGVYRTRPAYRYTVEDSIYLHPDFLGRGLGRLLLHELISRCSTKGFRQMIAVIGDSDNHASIRLHQAAGFTHVGTFRAVGFKFERWLDTVLMQRPLP